MPEPQSKTDPTSLPIISQTDLNVSLVAAQLRNETAQLSDLIERGANPLCRSGLALYSALENGNAAAVRLLCDAADSGDPRVSRILIEYLNYKCGASLVSFAPVQLSASVLELLIERGIAPTSLELWPKIVDAAYSAGGLALLEKLDRRFSLQELSQTLQHMASVQEISADAAATDFLTQRGWTVTNRSLTRQSQVAKRDDLQDYRPAVFAEVDPVSTSGGWSALKLAIKSRLRGVRDIDSLLLAACSEGDLKQVKHLVETGANVHYEDNAPIVDAANAGHTEIVRYLHEHGADIGARKGEVIRIAANLGNLELFSYCIDRDPTTIVHDQRALTSASEHLPLVEHLERKGLLNPNRLQTVLTTAIRSANIPVIEYMTSLGADVGRAISIEFSRSSGAVDPSVLSFSLLRGLPPSGEALKQAIDVRLRSGKPLSRKLISDPQMSPELLAFALMRAVSIEDNLTARRVLETDNVPAHHLESVMASALAKGALRAVHLLRKSGVPLPKLSGAQLVELGRNLSLNKLAYLSNSGFDLRAHNDSLLVGACAAGRAEVVQALCARAVDISSGSLAAMSVALREGWTEIARTLVLHGANPRLAEKSGMSTPACDSPNSGGIEAELERMLGSVSCRQYLGALQGLTPPDELRSLAAKRDYVLEKAGAVDFEQTFKDRLVSAGAWHQTPLFRILEASCFAAVELGGPEYTSSILRATLEELSKKPGIFKDAIAHTTKLSTKLSHFLDSVRSLTTNLCLPMWAFSRFDPTALTQLSHQQLHSVSLELEKETLRLLAGLSIAKLARLNDFFHSAPSVVPAEYQPFLADTKWVPFFRDEVRLSNGYSIYALRDQAGLLEEGRALKHCVGNGGYAAKCARGESQIISLRKDGQSAATIELTRGYGRSVISTPNGPSFSIEQFRSRDNEEPTYEMKEALHEFAKELKKGRIELDPEFGNSIFRPKAFQRSLSPLEQTIGIPLDEPELFDKVVQFYRNRETKLGISLVGIARRALSCTLERSTL
jgi:ankyrin repeat protein